MKKLSIMLFLSLPYIFCSCSTESISLIKNDGKLAIVSTDTRWLIHTKMIVWDHATVSFIKQKDPKKLWTDEKELINAADILITSTDKDNSVLANVLQEYHGTHLQLHQTGSNQQIIKLSETISHIESIRDAVVELDGKNRGYYYDQAGNYENNLQETYRKLQSRINEYNKQPFLLFSDEDMGTFLWDYWLEKKSIKRYASNYLSEEKQTRTKELQNVIQDKKIKIAFIKTNTEKETRAFLEKSWLTLYTINDMQEDTSAWGYLRIIEKLVNTFITAFNAYD